MKKFILIAGMLTATFFTYAQDDMITVDRPNTLFGRDKDVNIGWYIGTEDGYTCFGDRNVHMNGLSGGIILDHQYTIGASVSGWTNHDGLYYSNIKDSTGAYLEGGFGRMLFEYTLYPKSTVHLTFPVMIGGGAASLVKDRTGEDWDDYHYGRVEDNSIDTDVFFSVEPGIRAEVNIFRFMRLNAGVSYRYVEGLELMKTSHDLMNDFSATVGLKFGRF